jgi:hypothetical protein
MPIDNAQLTEFCNSDLRQLADILASAVTRGIDATATYYARNLGTIIDQGPASELIVDGSETDGRTRVAGGDVYNFVTLLADFDTFMNQGRRDVLAKWKVNANR